MATKSRLKSIVGVIALTAVVASSAFAQFDNRPPSRRQPANEKIIAGQDAPPGAFPFQVALIFSDAQKGNEFSSLTCGGSLIADTWVLTAGHCVTYSDGKREPYLPRELHVYVGSVNFQNGDRIPVKSVSRHPNYDPIRLDNDVALLQLERAPRKDAKVAKIGLIDRMRDSTLESVDTDLTIMGWGYTTEQGPTSKNLRYTTIKVVNQAECRDNILKNRSETLADHPSMRRIVNYFWIDPDKIQTVVDTITRNAGAIVNENMICAGDPNPPPAAKLVHDACQGDSGGPLVAKSGDKSTQVGIVSWGEGCGVPKLHGVYTRLGNFVEWIKTTMK